jgi:hypothetical protein
MPEDLAGEFFGARESRPQYLSPGRVRSRSPRIRHFVSF